ncbi:MAG: DNA alkylation repair protein, partial [Rhizobacter sp.]|nr:DNA alkylation repair protein [Rhizobacter sp.]
MAEPFKNLLNAQVVADIGRHLRRASPAFNHKRFKALATAGLDALELKARTHHICQALEATLPADFGSAAEVMEAALATLDTPLDQTLDGPTGARDDGLAGWAVWPLTEYVARHGHADTPRALQALHAMTQRFTAEWAIRPFLLRSPELSFAALHQWASDASPHVRRLVSEGSRPR